MKRFFLPSLQGIIKDYHKRIIPDSKLSDGENVVFKNAEIKNRWGYGLFGGPLNGAIMAIIDFDQVVTYSKNLIIITTRDAYKYNFETGAFEFITKKYTEGTVSVSDGIHVTGVGTSWDDSWPGGIFQIKFGTTDINGVGTPDYWLPVVSFDSETGLHIDGCAGEEVEFWPLRMDNKILVEDNDYTFVVGMRVVGQGIPEGSVITNIDEMATHNCFTISENVTINDEFEFVTIPEANVIAELHGINGYGGEGEWPTNSFHIEAPPGWFPPWPDTGREYGDLEIGMKVIGYGVPDGTVITGFGDTGSYRTIYLSNSFQFDNGGVCMTIIVYSGDVNVMTGVGHWDIPDTLTDGVGISNVSIGDYGINISQSPGYSSQVTGFDGNWIIFEYNIFNGWGTDYEATASPVPGELSGSTYVIRECWSGDEADHFSYAMPFNDQVGDKTLVVANGIEPLRVWEGQDEFTDLSYHIISGTTVISDATVTIDPTRIRPGMYVTGTGIPANTTVLSLGTTTIELSAQATASGTVDLTFYSLNRIAKFVAFFGSISYEHMLAANMVDGADTYPQTISYSNAGETELWDGTLGTGTGSFYELIDSNDAIAGLVALKTRMMVYKENSITEMWAAAQGNEDPFDFYQNKIRETGTPSIRSVIDLGNYHIFLGNDNIYMFDGINISPVGFDLIEALENEINKNNKGMTFAYHFGDERLYVLFVPTGDDDNVTGFAFCDSAYVYDYANKHWTIWRFYDYETETGILATAIGRYAVENSMTYAQMYAQGTTWESVNGGLRWADLMNYEKINRYLIGDKDGYLYEFSELSPDDNGVGIYATFTTKDYPLNDPKHTFKLVEAVIGFVAQAEGSVRIRASVDFGYNWSEWVTVPQDTQTAGDYAEHVANFVERGRQVRFQIENVDGSNFQIESINIGFNDIGGVVK